MWGWEMFSLFLRGGGNLGGGVPRRLKSSALTLPVVSSRLLATRICSVEATKRWVDEMVIGKGLCPFAAGSGLRVSPCHSESLLEHVDDEICHLLDEGTATETTLIPLTHEYYEGDPLSLIQASYSVLEFIQESDYPVQVVNFHPLNRHSVYTEGPLDQYDFVTRAPFPTLHLLREVDLLRAAQYTEGDVDKIPARNMQRLRKESLGDLQRQWDSLRGRRGFNSWAKNSSLHESSSEPIVQPNELNHDALDNHDSRATKRKQGHNRQRKGKKVAAKREAAVLDDFDFDWDSDGGDESSSFDDGGNADSLGGNETLTGKHPKTHQNLPKRDLSKKNERKKRKKKVTKTKASYGKDYEEEEDVEDDSSSQEDRRIRARTHIVGVTQEIAQMMSSQLKKSGNIEPWNNVGSWDKRSDVEQHFPRLKELFCTFNADASIEDINSAIPFNAISNPDGQVLIPVRKLAKNDDSVYLTVSAPEKNGKFGAPLMHIRRYYRGRGDDKAWMRPSNKGFSMSLGLFKVVKDVVDSGALEYYYTKLLSKNSQKKRAGKHLTEPDLSDRSFVMWCDQKTGEYFINIDGSNVGFKRISIAVVTYLKTKSIHIDFRDYYAPKRAPKRGTKKKGGKSGLLATQKGISLSKTDMDGLIEVVKSGAAEWLIGQFKAWRRQQMDSTRIRDDDKSKRIQSKSKVIPLSSKLRHRSKSKGDLHGMNSS